MESSSRYTGKKSKRPYLDVTEQKQKTTKMPSKREAEDYSTSGALAWTITKSKTKMTTTRGRGPNLERPSEAFSLFSKRFDRSTHIFSLRDRRRRNSVPGSRRRIREKWNRPGLVGSTEWNSPAMWSSIWNDPSTWLSPVWHHHCWLALGDRATRRNSAQPYAIIKIPFESCVIARSFSVDHHLPTTIMDVVRGARAKPFQLVINHLL